MSTIIVINIGSLTTKVGLYKGSQRLIRETIEHTRKDLAPLQGYDEWLRFHEEAVDRALEPYADEGFHADLIVSRGGLTKPLQGGAYRISEAMLRDLRSGAHGWHPTNVAPAIAERLGTRYRAEAIIYDAPVADELAPLARYSGLKGAPRRAGFHVLSQKSAARRAARRLNIPYSEARLIVAHLGGGITVGAHRRGMIVDGSHGLDEGPFTPQRTGGLPLGDVVARCFSGDHSQSELTELLFTRGGVLSYLGDHDMERVEGRIAQGEPEALEVVQAMGYQVSKEIGALAAVLKGRLDGVVLTGNLCRASTLIKEIQSRISFLGNVLIFPGEDELENLAAGGRSVLAGAEEVWEYT